MSDKRHWVWLQLCLGAAKKFEPIISNFGSIEKLYDSNYLQRKFCEGITEKVLDRMESITLEDADKVLKHCNDNGWQVITFEDSNYPKKLKQISEPPAVLYVEGTLPQIDKNLTIGVVGTREASPYGLKSAKLLSKGVARCGGIIISGGAKGIDCSSHIGAIEAMGTTVVVLGCGLAANFMHYNLELRNLISSSGAIITEYPPKTVPSKYTYPQRNRIISGLSDGVLVIEASENSGSLITASYATAQNRDLFAIPSSILDCKFEGTNKLIADGAMVAVDTNAIISCYGEKYKNLDLEKVATNLELLTDEYAEKDVDFLNDEQITFENLEQHRENQLEINSKEASLTGVSKIVYDALKDDFLDIDTIANKTSLEIKTVLMTLTMLELDGLAEAGMGKRYKRKQA